MGANRETPGITKSFKHPSSVGPREKYSNMDHYGDMNAETVMTPGRNNRMGGNYG